MDAKKTIGVTILVAVMVMFGVFIVTQMRREAPEMTSGASGVTQRVSPRPMPAQSGSTEDSQAVSNVDTKKPATVDAIVGDIDNEANTDQTAVSKDADGDAAVISKEGDSLNNVSQFYDEKSL